MLTRIVFGCTSFIVGLFFFLSAYFHRASFDRRGFLRFIGNRLFKLALPLGIYLTAVVPFIMYAYYLNFRDHSYISFWRYYITVYWGIGPFMPEGWTGPAWSDQQFLQMWFVEVLLIFGVIYALARCACKLIFTGEQPRADTEQPVKLSYSHMAIAGLIALLAFGYFLLRIWFQPFEWLGWRDAIQIKPARAAMYVIAFTMGLVAYWRNWIFRLKPGIGKVWGAVAVVMFMLLLSGVLDKYFSLTLKGGSAPAAAQAILDATLGVSASVGLIILFRERFNSPTGKFTKLLSDNVYCVYIVHVPVLVPIQYALIGLKLPPIVLGAIATIVSVPLSFIVSILIRRIPGAKAML